MGEGSQQLPGRLSLKYTYREERSGFPPPAHFFQCQDGAEGLRAAMSLQAPGERWLCGEETRASSEAPAPASLSVLEVRPHALRAGSFWKCPRGRRGGCLVAGDSFTASPTPPRSGAPSTQGEMTF